MLKKKNNKANGPEAQVTSAHCVLLGNAVSG